ncbi:MAG: NUMOD3 domain-containing DNA-binding protein, partial [Nanoarchaeota archaeon]
MPTGRYKRTEIHKKILSESHKGKKSHFYKDGRTLKKYHCIDCKKDIKDYHAKRCGSCSAKERTNRPEFKEIVSGKNCNFYIDGRTSMEYNCINCGSKIGMKSNRCKSCNAQERWSNPIFKEKMSGENHPNWKSDKIEYCGDCGDKVSCQSTGRCNSCSNKIKWQNPIFRDKNKGNTGKRQSEYTRKKIGLANSIKVKQAWKRGLFDGVFKSPTKPEKEIMKRLGRLGIDYIFQFRPEGYSRPYDFYVPNRNLLIEFDGVYWHSFE